MAIMARTFTTKPAGCTFDAQRAGEDMNRIIVGILGAALIAGPALAKGKPPNIGAAHQLVKQAIQRLTAAQRANEYELGGHAAKAKELLEQAEKEIAQAWAAAEKGEGVRGARPLETGERE